jgi:dephospho-CoA kinase
MPLYLVTGLSGCGKSTVCAELKSRGYEAYDGDEDHLAEWYNNKTRRAVYIDRKDRTPKFLQTHSRDILRPVVEKLAVKAKDKTVFLCGDPMNEDELRDLFEEVFALVADKQTIKHRLATRTNNQWGKEPYELEFTFSFHKKALEDAKKYNYVTIDATKPTKDIVDLILEKVDTDS